MDVGVLITRPQTLRGCYPSAWDVKDAMPQPGRGVVSRTSAHLPNLFTLLLWTNAWRKQRKRGRTYFASWPGRNTMVVWCHVLRKNIVSAGV